MAKKPCPNCKTLFDYEFNSWVCPECGTVITGSMEGEVHDWYCEHDRPKQEYKSATTVNDYDKKHGTGKYKNRRKIAAIITLTLILAVALLIVAASTGVFSKLKSSFSGSTDYSYTEEPTAESQDYTESSKNETDLTDETASIGEYILMDGYDLVINEIFVPAWNELPEVEGYRFVAVSYERSFQEEELYYGFSGMEAWLTLHDNSAGMYLTPLYESDIIDISDAEGLPFEYEFCYDLGAAEGTLLFLVKEDSREFELAIFEGINDGTLDTSMITERRITIPVTITDEEAQLQ